MTMTAREKALEQIKRTLTGTGGLVAGTWRHLGGRGDKDDAKEWAKLLRVRHEAGEILGHCQIEAYRQALGIAQ